MGALWITITVLVKSALVAVVFMVGIYSALVALRNLFKGTCAHIVVQLKRSYDLIPNLGKTAKGYMTHERGTLEAVAVA